MDIQDKILIENYFKDVSFNMIHDPFDKMKYHFIDPGMQYDGQLWDWDSYFSVVALMSICERYKNDKSFNYEEKRKKVIDGAKGSVKLFLSIQLEDGYIPIMTNNVRLNDMLWKGIHETRDDDNQHKPFLCQAILNISEYDNDYTWFPIEPLIKYMDYYKRKQFHERSGLYVWINDVMIGMDNNPSVYGLPYKAVGDIYLNTFMYQELVALSKLLKIRGDNRAEEYEKEAERLKATILKECWDERDGIFYSVFVDLAKNHMGSFHTGMEFFWKSLPIRIRMAICFLPMFAGISTKEQNDIMVEKHYLDDKMLSPYGFRSTAADERMYYLGATSNPSNSLGPIWMIYNYIVYTALKNAGKYDLAKDLVDRVVKTFANGIRKNGIADECYNPENGEPIMNENFISWNSLIIKMIDECEKF